MPTWLEIEKRFIDLEPTLRNARLDRQYGAAGEYWRIAASFDELASSRFESVCKMAGTKLAFCPNYENLPKDVADAPNKLFLWYRALCQDCTNYFPGTPGYQTDEQGNHMGWIYSGSIRNPAGVAAAYCLELSIMETDKSAPTSMPLTVHISGANARLNISSTDNSSNNYTVSSATIFQELREVVQKNVAGQAQTELVESINALEKSAGSSGFTSSYKEFIQQAANHMTIISPFLPALTSMLTGA